MSSPLSGIVAIGFDLDNTLYDRDTAMKAWLRSIFPGEPEVAELAIAVDDSGFIPRRELYTWLAERLSWAKDWRDIEVRYQADLMRLISDNPGMTMAVQELRRRFQLAVLTNGSGHFQRRKLGCLGVARCFEPDRIFVSGEIGYDKPDERAFRPMIQAFGVSPEEILFVGDNPSNDIEGAARLGMRTCWIRLSPHHECPVVPDFTLTSVELLPSILLND
jgi:putative hydrolase of the HAD superfamily